MFLIDEPAAGPSKTLAAAVHGMLAASRTRDNPTILIVEQKIRQSPIRTF